MDDLTRPGRCVRCGADLPGGTTEGLCPACLMAAALSGLSSDVSADATTVISSSRDRTGRGSTRLTTGQAFGPYLIGRLLGRGGMGEVYEAEHVPTGRRVALKVLNQQLAGPEDRARFLREGQLAASINHPHAVYIFGSEDIGGTPVISMELVPGGTLKDLVEQHGPLAPSRAVDAVLDVIAGLDAAYAGGVLHRDVKPSNCFVDASGSVKVGDFGLSISTLARDVSELTQTGTFQGTPQFAALEQLRGQPLDVRADIYAVGATLHYLLTGRPPFDDRDLATLVARIASEPPPSPRVGRRTVPQGLAAVVLRCLAKDRRTRYGSYSELDDALRPFSSERPTPATLGLRFVAGLVDKALLTLLTAPLALSPKVGFVPPASITLGVNGVLLDGPAAPLFAAAVAYAVTLAYYALLEGLGGASLGKRLCGLRVSGGGARPGVWRALLRTVIFTAPFFWPLLLSKAVGPSGAWPVAGAALIVINNTVGWILFTSMRRRNGYAGWHDLASGTRVVATGRSERPAALEVAGAQPSRDPRLPRRVGPYDVKGALGSTSAGELIEGFDPSLRRRVWLHILHPGAPALTPALRDLDRRGRLRWLNGRRLADEAWDAFDAPDGAPLLQVAATRQPWRVVRSWLVDVARELEAAERDGTTPPLALDRVWITRGSRALLLDVVIRGAAARPSACESVPQLLASVAKVGLNDEPLPLSARAFLTACEFQSLPPDLTVWSRSASWKRGPTTTPFGASVHSKRTARPRTARPTRMRNSGTMSGRNHCSRRFGPSANVSGPSPRRCLP